MKEIDVRLSCPEPVLIVMDEMDACSKGASGCSVGCSPHQR